MIKDRYPLKLEIVEAHMLFAAIGQVYERFGDTKTPALMLPLSVIQPFYKRLSGALLLPNGKVKVSLRKTEALAYHNLYMSGIMINSILTAQINTEIHRTL